MDKQTGKRVNFMLRVPAELANEIKDLAWNREVSANTISILLLRYAIQHWAKGTINDRLTRMGVR